MKEQTPVISQLDHQRLKARVEKAGAALMRAKRLEDELLARRQAAHDDLQTWLWDESIRIADLIRNGALIELPTGDGGRGDDLNRLDFQCRLFSRIVVRLRSEFIEATRALDAINLTERRA